MERIVNKADNFKQADDYDVKQQINMTVEERQKAAKYLREHFYGKNKIDVKESRVVNVRS